MTPPPLRAAVTMLAACVCFTVMSLAVGAAHRGEPGLSSIASSAVRSAVNLAIILVVARGSVARLLGDRRPALWLRGVAGAIALLTYFAALPRIGVGEAAFLNNTSAFWVAALSPWLLAERAAAGAIRIAGTDAGALHPGARRKLGLHFVPEERLGRGAVPTLGLAHNLLLTRQEAISHPRWGGGWIRVHALEQQAAGIIARFNVKAGGPRALARSLSGGNLQKFIVGREIDAAPRLFIVSQPTWGVDVGAAAQIRGEILALRDAGCAVLVVSEELEELFELSDRLHVMARGRLSPSIAVADATVEQIGEWMSGLWQGEAHAQA